MGLIGMPMRLGPRGLGRGAFYDRISGSCIRRGTLSRVSNLQRLLVPQCSAVRVYSVVAEAKPKKSRPSKEDYSFHADVGVSWNSLGLTNDVSGAAMKAGLDRPSVIQAASIPRILQGGDVVVAAETGSGKTHAYLLPILQLLDKSFEEFKQRKAEERAFVPRSFALVLCPNATLCQQVADMANGVCSSLEKAVKVAVITGGQGWPMSQPDIVIATPGALINHLFSFDPKRRRRTAFLRDARFVVFDEADMLLSGGFAREVVNRLIPMLRLEEKRLATEEKASLVVPGQEPAVKEDAKPWTDFEPSKEETPESEDDADLEKEASEWVEMDETNDPELTKIAADGGDKEDETKKKRRKTYRKLYKRSKQYIFVAATLPVIGKKTPAIMLAYQFPDASWVNGDFLHCHNPRVNHRWVEVDSKKRVEALLRAISERPEGDATPSFQRTMVFANTVESVTAITKILEKVNIVPLCYHRSISLDERISNLKRFQDEGGILLCTDSGARGLDIRDIGHIVQAEFALSAVDFLHRVGRTGRAGNPGLVTSLYTESSRPLVEAVRQAITAGEPVEGAFSRKRSFRNKLRKQELQQAEEKEAPGDEASPLQQEKEGASAL